MRPKPLMPIRVVIDSVLLFRPIENTCSSFFECVRLERPTFHVKHCVNTRERYHHDTPTLLRVSPSVGLYQGIISQTQSQLLFRDKGYCEALCFSWKMTRLQ